MGMHSMEARIETLAPVILAANRSALMTGSTDFFSGTILRGIFAMHYLERHPEIKEAACSDPLFRRFFFGGLRFAPAFPMKHGLAAFVLPRSLQVSKDGTRLNDMLLVPDPDKEAGFKTKRGLGVKQGCRIDSVSVAKDIRLHIHRSKAENRLAGSSQDGSIFSYEAIDAGQRFCGAVYGSEETLAAFRQELRDTAWECYAGRSKYTQYGRCRLELGNARAVRCEAAPSGERLFLRLETPLLTDSILCDAREALTRLLRPLGDGIEIGEIYGAQEEVAQFNGLWGMRAPCRQALAAGTVVELRKKDGWDTVSPDVLAEMLYGGLGKSREEGFGQLRIWDAAKDICPWPKAEGADAGPALREGAGTLDCLQLPEVTRVARQILLERMLERARNRAFDDAQSARMFLSGKAHAFARLEALLGDREDLGNIRQRFQAGLKRELSKGTEPAKGTAQSPLASHLREIRLGGRELLPMLRDGSALPDEALGRIPAEWQPFAKDAGIARAEGDRCALDDPACSGAAYYEYWLAFFRVGRKLASDEGE